MMTNLLGVVTLVMAVAAAAEPLGTVMLVDDFSGDEPTGWSSSVSPNYFKGDTGARGLAVVEDSDRGRVLSCNVAFVDPGKSEPVFITRKLEDERRPLRTDVVGVRFWAKVTGAGIAPEKGFRVRLRTGDAAFIDYDVQEQLGRPFPVGEWVHVELDASIGPNVRNVWKNVFGRVRQLTFRLDDVDDRNAEFALLLGQIEIVTRCPQVVGEYAPVVSARPDDGETRVLFIKHRAAGYYHLEEAIRAVDPQARIDVFHYRGLHFELFGFPERREEVLAYDLIVMLDVDPFVMTFDQCAWIADAVASGSHLAFFTGPSSPKLHLKEGKPEHSRDIKAPLRAVLPVTFPAEEEVVTIQAPPRPQEGHVLNEGLSPQGLGHVWATLKVVPKLGAVVAWEAGDEPLVVTASAERGGATVVNTWPKTDGANTGDFYTSGLSDDFLRRLVQFALGRVPKISITGLSMPSKEAVGAAQLTLLAASPGVGVGDIRLLVDGNVVAPSREGQGEFAEFAFDVPLSDAAETVHEVRVERLLGGKVTDYRDMTVVGRNPVGLDVAWVRNKYTFAPGSPVELTAAVRRPVPKTDGEESPSVLKITAVLQDPGSEYEWVVPPMDRQPTTARFGGALPNLASGEYVMRVDAVLDGGALVNRTMPCYVVDPVPEEDFYPLMSIVGIESDTHRLDEQGIRGRLEDLVQHGFNTAAITGTSNFKSDRPSNHKRLKGYAESLAQRSGMATTYEYSRFTTVSKKGTTQPCVYDPGFRNALRAKIEWQIDVAKRTPRLLTAKILDEPHISPENLDFCRDCYREFLDHYGIKLEPGMELRDDPYKKWAFADFMGDYVAEGYSHTQAIMKEEGADVDLVLTYMAHGLGYHQPLKCQQDALDWTRYADWADFDIYPYFYPESQRIRMVQASFGMTYMRDVARVRGCPWGYYVELDDRNWPFQKNPKEASAECAFTAVAHGADYLNTFINRLFGTGTSARPERWETTGKAFRLLRRVGPVLKRMPAVRAPVAVLYPNAQEAIGNGYSRPQYTLAMLKGGFGDVDILNEEVVVETQSIPYRMLILLGTEYLNNQVLPSLKEWLNEGGVLVTDRLPSKTHRGERIEWGIVPEDLTVASPPERCPFAFTVTPVGRGRLIRIEEGVEESLKTVLEAPSFDPAEVKRKRVGLAEILRSAVLPTVSVDYSETAGSVDVVEAGLRGNDDATLLAVVNHQPAAQNVRVSVRRPEIAWWVDLTTMEPVVPEQVADGCVRFETRVDGRWARLLAGYPRRPQKVRIALKTRRPKCGQELVYSVKVAGTGGKAVRGGILLEVNVTGPDGESVPRFGWSTAPADGVAEFQVPVPLNAPHGKYTITATAPQAGVSDKASFRIR